ncbi:hypothetical protein TNCV_1271471, partial [Trichonephila clavipes]
YLRTGDLVNGTASPPPSVLISQTPKYIYVPLAGGSGWTYQIHIPDLKWHQPCHSVLDDRSLILTDRPASKPMLTWHNTPTWNENYQPPCFLYPSQRSPHP